jgi:lipoprotein Spr
MRDTANRFNNDITCSNIVSAAQPWLGTPYKYGGTDFDGVDCSGFVQQIFLQVFDVVLPRTTREMFEQGVFVRGGRFSCGDLLFFRNIGGRGGVNHVGIYIGNNRFIHASTTQGVVISDLAENYYAENFVSARRY